MKKEVFRHEIYNYGNNNNNFKTIKLINMRQQKPTKIIPSVFRRHTQYALQRWFAKRPLCEQQPSCGIHFI
jgi:hypothetical protein